MYNSLFIDVYLGHLFTFVRFLIVITFYRHLGGGLNRYFCGLTKDLRRPSVGWRGNPKIRQSIASWDTRIAKATVEEAGCLKTPWENSGKSPLRTSISKICGWQTAPPVERARKERICELLQKVRLLLLLSEIPRYFARVLTVIRVFSDRLCVRHVVGTLCTLGAWYSSRLLLIPTLHAGINRHLFLIVIFIRFHCFFLYRTCAVRRRSKIRVIAV